LLAASAATLLLACVAQWGVFEAGQERARFQSLEEEVIELRIFASDVEKVETVHRIQKKNDIEVRSDDPTIDAVGGLHYGLVIFSDVECPNCARFDEYLKQTILPIWSGHLKVIWKHYPNTSEHPNSMQGARALEAARLQGKFWQLRDWLLPRRESLGVVNWSEAATELAMDADRFLKDMQSAQVTRRIGQDSSLARKLGVRGTPGVYLNGRLVSRLMRRSAGFWELQSESLREIRDSRGQDW
jgi:protein-disulfide isomerase